MSRQIKKSELRGLHTRPGDCRIVHVLLTPGADADLLYLRTAYRALVLKAVSNSAIMRRALNLLTARIAGLHGQDEVKAEIVALEHERKPAKAAASKVADLSEKLRNNTATGKDLEEAIKLVKPICARNKAARNKL